MRIRTSTSSSASPATWNTPRPSASASTIARRSRSKTFALIRILLAAAALLALTQVEEAARELLPVPGIVASAGVASPTRSPWIVANGWRFLRQPAAKFRYDLPAGKAALAAAEKHAYRADALLKIDAGDADTLARMTAFLDGLPPANLP